MPFSYPHGKHRSHPVVSMPKSNDPPSSAQHSLYVIEDVMRSIRSMSIQEREAFMRILELWINDDKFGFEGKYVLTSLANTAKRSVCAKIPAGTRTTNQQKLKTRRRTRSKCRSC